jgi:hypothetical protein
MDHTAASESILREMSAMIVAINGGKSLKLSAKAKILQLQLLDALTTSDKALILISPQASLEHLNGPIANSEIMFRDRLRLQVSDAGLVLVHAWEVPGGGATIQDVFIRSAGPIDKSPWTWPAKDVKKPTICIRTIFSSDENLRRCSEEITCILLLMN